MPQMADVLLFGAGASKEYVGVKGPFFCDPDFFAVVEQMWKGWLRSGVLRFLDWFTDARPHHYDGGRWDWPTLKDRLEAEAGRPVAQLGLEEAFSLVHSAGPELEDLFCRCIELAIFHQMRATKPGNVPVHVDFLRRTLRPGSTILTFNYDPLLEVALGHLRAHGIEWNPLDGYGIALQELGHSSPPAAESNVQVLKLHGSMNWLVPVASPANRPFRLLRIRPGSLRGQGRLVEREEGIMRPVFVPPGPKKDYEAYGLEQVWARAHEALQGTTSLTVIGYRLPETDEAARHLLYTATAHLRASPDVTYVTRGDGDAVARFKELFPMASVHLNGFRDYARTLSPS